MGLGEAHGGEARPTGVRPTGDGFSGTAGMNLILHVCMTLFQC